MTKVLTRLPKKLVTEADGAVAQPLVGKETLKTGRPRSPRSDDFGTALPSPSNLLTQQSRRLEVELATLAAQHKHGPRLTDELRALLCAAVQTPTDASAHGQRSLLGFGPAQDAAHALLEASPGTFRELAALLTQASSLTEQAVLLRAVGWRRGLLRESATEDALLAQGALPDGYEKTDALALEELRELAGWVRGAPADELASWTTLFLPSLGAGATAPAGPSPRQGMLFQYYLGACGVTIAQLMTSSDPRRGALLRDGGFDDRDPKAKASTQQSEWFEAVTGTSPLYQHGLELWDWLSPKLAALGPELRAPLERYCQGKADASALRTPPVAAAVTALRSKNDGRPTDEDLGLVRHYHQTAPERPVLGTHLLGLLNAATESFGRAYEHFPVEPWADEGGRQGRIRAALDRMEPVLRDELNYAGVPVLLTSDKGDGHFIAFTDVRRDARGKREFQVFDPGEAGHLRSDGTMGGIDWVPEQQILDGTFCVARMAFCDPPDKNPPRERLRMLETFYLEKAAVEATAKAG